MVFLAVSWIAVLAAIGGFARAVAAGTEADNQQAAQQDAAALFASVSLPPDATVSQEEPAGTGGSLSRASTSVATPNLVALTGWWTASTSPAATLEWIKQHVPSGSSHVYASSGDGPGGRHVDGLGFQWPAVTHVLGQRFLILQVVEADDGSTAIRADAQVVWLVPRPASEDVPPGMRLLRIDVIDRNNRSRWHRTITNSARIAHTAQLLDGLERTQPGVGHCGPAFTYRVRLLFRRARDATPSVRAIVDPEHCWDVSMQVNGTRQPRLINGFALGRYIEALGARFRYDPHHPNRPPTR